ncbi:YlqD protein [Neobacillus bataviensis]|uniref:YlqD protein n=1 Tax=Neobacillus bataviensis TaxID=220685 RepID=A0A561DZS8_9BACI|nr:YlqD family protein [Neobacillus bataviensis]TWE08852.1 YlqD protein [Neobacillus bataviensis]
MQLIQTVVVKQVLTEKSKEQLYEKFQGRMLQLKKESEQLLFEQKRLEKTKNFSSEALKKKFETEMRMRKEKIKLLEFQMEQLHNLPLGSEIQEREVQALVEVNVGDQWDNSVGQSTIIIEDGIVKEIR